MRLSNAALGRIAPEVERFAYDRHQQAVGIVHLGIGAFHRAHQAWYTDRAMDAGDRDWAILGVSLRSPAVAEQMNPQDGLYTLVERSAGGARSRLIGSVREVLVAARSRAGVAIALIAPTTHIVSLTVTEKGYCRAADGSLDFALAAEGSFYPVLADALRQRHDAGIDGLTLLSCDNLADNGAQLARLMRAYLSAHDPGLVDWFDAECACPATMIDRIVPATTDADRAHVSALLGGIEDQACVVTEPFSQWVIEDRFAGPRPAWDKVGAELVTDVAPYETAKLRMLNGAHSALAYLGLERGHAYVHEAVIDPDLRPLIERLMREEAAPTIAAAPGQNLAAYADALLARFANPALQHRLVQIAMDGSQKIPQRWLETLAANRAMGRSCPAILAALAAWFRHLRAGSDEVNDPRAPELRAILSTNDLSDGVRALFAPGGTMAGGWRPDGADLRAISGG